MGSSVSAVVANFYMECFEEQALEMALTKPRLWKRYVDIFCILRKGSTEELRHASQWSQADHQVHCSQLLVVVGLLWQSTGGSSQRSLWFDSQRMLASSLFYVHLKHLIL